MGAREAFSLLQNTQEEGLEYKEDSEMTIVFPNIATNEFIWKKNTAKAKSVNNDLEKFLSKPSDIRMPSVSIETKKIRVEWPTILSSDCSTWLSTRKAEANKKQQEKEKAGTSGGPRGSEICCGLGQKRKGRPLESIWIR